MTDDQARIIRLEGILARQAVDLANLATALAAAQNAIAVVPSGGYQDGNGGTPVKSYWCIGDGTAHVATGTWPTLTAATFTSDVYATNGTAMVNVASGATINWFYLDAMSTTANKLIPVIPNGDGSTWDAQLESCTAV